MRCSGKRIITGILVLIMIVGILCTSASAATYSSLYLNSYSGSVLPDKNGMVVISAHVTGCGFMDEIGVKTIFLYESENGKDFHRVALYESTDYPVMMGAGTVFNRDLFRYQGKVGRYYVASVYVYAGKNGSGDTRNYTTTMIMAKA